MATTIDCLGQIQDIKTRLNVLRACLDQTGMQTPNPNNTQAVSQIDTAYGSMVNVEQAIFTGAATPNA